MTSRTNKTCTVVAMVLLLAPMALAANLYRYTNAEGVTVVDYQVPAAFVSKGYEILNKDGVVVRVVPRALTEEEKETLTAQQELEAAASAEEQRLREWDESLMLRYSTLEDIEAARERALRELRIRLSILKGNKRSLKQQVENFQAQAADLERSGKEVDVARISAIEDIQAEIDSTDRSIRDRAREIEQVSEAYDNDIERFRMLLDVVELRQTLLTQQQAERED
jgi:hypothetical protein